MYVLHIYGKHKLHHGKWMLVTIGVTVLAYNKDKKKITHNFRPLVYMFVKQHESEESIAFLCTALQAVSILYSGGPLDPDVSACICIVSSMYAESIHIPDTTSAPLCITLYLLCIYTRTLRIV